MPFKAVEFSLLHGFNKPEELGFMCSPTSGTKHGTHVLFCVKNSDLNMCGAQNSKATTKIHSQLGLTVLHTNIGGICIIG